LLKVALNAINLPTLLSFFFWPLCCLHFFDLRLPITPLVSSHLSNMYMYTHTFFMWLVGLWRLTPLSSADNTMAKRKRTKGQTTVYKTLHRKLKIEQHITHLHLGNK
jgi:hypothetical protein